MTSVSAGHIVTIPAQTVRSERPERGSNQSFPDEKSRALPTELKPTPTSPLSLRSFFTLGLTRNGIQPKKKRDRKEEKRENLVTFRRIAKIK